MIAGRLSLNYGKYVTLASAAFLTAKNVEFEKNLPEEFDKNLS